MIQIRPWLYVGKELEAYDKSLLCANKIGAMLHLNEPINTPDIESHHLYLMDRGGISQKELAQALDFIFRNKIRGINILITSDAGISRSVAIAIAVVKQDENLPLIKALEVVLKYHHKAKPHPSLWYSLENYFQERIGFTSVLNLYGKMKDNCTM